jgi:hypothetical protein
MAHEIGHNLGRIQLGHSDWPKFLFSRHFILAPFFCHNIRMEEYFSDLIFTAGSGLAGVLLMIVSSRRPVYWRQ